jgi:hypothetical protein
MFSWDSFHCEPKAFVDGLTASTVAQYPLHELKGVKIEDSHSFDSGLRDVILAGVMNVIGIVGCQINPKNGLGIWIHFGPAILVPADRGWPVMKGKLDAFGLVRDIPISRAFEKLGCSDMEIILEKNPPPQHPGGPCWIDGALRERTELTVEVCGKTFRADDMRRHYLGLVRRERIELPHIRRLAE